MREGGKVIVTNMNNYSMPLIRYEIGDRAVKVNDRCSCGALLPVIGKITGVVTDHFLKKDGILIHGMYFTHLFYLKDWIDAFQIIQKDFINIKIRIVLKEKKLESEKSNIEDKIRQVMGGQVHIYWGIVDGVILCND